MSLEGEALRGCSTDWTPGSANPPGAKSGSWPGYMVGTLWADKVLPWGNGLLLPCVELVLDDFEDLLFVGRLLLPVNGTTGGRTVAGGTFPSLAKRLSISSFWRQWRA